MAHVIGAVNSLSELVNAIFTACINNGWTRSDDVIHKGDVHVRIREVTGSIEFLGGTGVDAGDNLTGAGPAIVRIRPFAQPFTFPMTYEVHILTDPDEVYVVVNYAVSFYQWAAWGKSIVGGLPGTGVWYCASQHAGNASSISIDPGTDQTFNGLHRPVLLGTLVAVGSPSTTQSGYVQHGLDGETWNPQNISGSNNGLAGYAALVPLINLLPSNWNDETVLLPVQAWRPRASNKLSLVADLVHARHCRIDFHDPGDVVEIGDERWKLYPCYAKNASERDGGGSVPIQHTGTMGFAVRYTGV